jgi:hypothetical protein
LEPCQLCHHVLDTFVEPLPGVVHVGAPLAEGLDPGSREVALMGLSPQSVFQRRAALVVLDQLLTR